MNTPTEDILSDEQICMPREAQLRLAEQRRKLAIMRYETNVRHGNAWFKPVDNPTKKAPIDNSTLA